MNSVRLAPGQELKGRIECWIFPIGDITPSWLSTEVWLDTHPDEFLAVRERILAKFNIDISGAGLAAFDDYFKAVRRRQHALVQARGRR